MPARALARACTRRHYFVSTLGLEPELFLLTTGTFNLVVKDQSAFRLSGAPSVQGGDTQMRLRLSSKPLETTCSAAPLSTQCAHRISTVYAHGNDLAWRWYPRPRSLCAQQNTSSSPLQRRRMLFPARAEAEDYRLRKDLLEVLAKNAQTLRGALSPNASSVAGANFRILSLLSDRCRTSDESCKKRPASHTLLSTCFFIPDLGPEKQGGVYWEGTYTGYVGTAASAVGSASLPARFVHRTHMSS